MCVVYFERPLCNAYSGYPRGVDIMKKDQGRGERRRGRERRASRRMDVAARYISRALLLYTLAGRRSSPSAALSRARTKASTDVGDVR